MKTGNLVIKWHHSIWGDENQYTTSCVIEIGKSMYYGVALCHKKDQFCKAVGRKLSLARALRIAGLSKDERTKVWEDYRTIGQKKRW